MSYRTEPENLMEYIQELEDRIRALEVPTQIHARSWTISENATGDIIFTHINGRIVTISTLGTNDTI